MFKKVAAVFVFCLPALALDIPAYAQEVSFDPNASCLQVMEESPNGAAIWAFGYLASKIQNARAIEELMIESFLRDFEAACKTSPDQSFFAIVRQLLADVPDVAASSRSKNIVVAPQERTGETQEMAQQVLAALRAPDADLARILSGLKPAPEDVRALFPEAMAVKLIEMYDRLFGERLADESFPPPPYDVSVRFTSTGKLANDPVLAELPGGFKNVLDKFLIDVPFGLLVVGFPSIDDRMSLSGLVFVNDRWVLMMRPWRGLQGGDG